MTPALTGPSIRRTADAVVHLCKSGRAGGLARAQHLPPERRREIGRRSNVAGLAALAPKFDAARARIEGHVVELAAAIKRAASIGNDFSTAGYIAARNWPNERGILKAFRTKFGINVREYHQQHFVEVGTR